MVRPGLTRRWRPPGRTSVRPGHGATAESVDAADPDGFAGWIGLGLAAATVTPVELLAWFSRG
ncbi:hypothetical protein [Kutzneria sp. NPDC052558]|uniref:hypothetical protein n=1 Tax=Kutzneria sp. NPDC052558 TaxID=3364121 RepID=UPI0037CB0901